MRYITIPEAAGLPGAWPRLSWAILRGHMVVILARWAFAMLWLAMLAASGSAWSRGRGSDWLAVSRWSALSDALMIAAKVAGAASACLLGLAAVWG